MKSQALYPYQERVDAFTKDRPRVGMFVFYGGGKTYMSLKWVEQLHLAHKQVLPILVLTMKSLVTQWGAEIKKHCSLPYTLVEGNIKKRVESLRYSQNICVLNYDAVRSPTLLKLLKKIHFRTVIADESTMLKESRTFRFKTWRKLLKDVPFRALLTGKPILERPEDIWSQALFLDEGQMLGTSFWKFRYTYFAPGPPWRPYEWALKEGAGAAIAALLNQKCIQIEKKEVAQQLPPKVYNTVHLKMPEATRKLYLKLKKDFEVELPSGEVFDTMWAMVKASKMHQLCQGFMYTEDGKWEDIDDTKLTWLRENLPLMLENGPILLWVCFKAMQYRVAKLLGGMGLRFGCFRSKHTQLERAQTIRAFNAGLFDILLLSQQTGAFGLNLQRANQAIFVCTDYKAALRENAEDRCHRIGSEIHKSVTYYDLVQEKSLDEVVLKAIKRKLNIAEEILRHIREE